MAPAVFKQRCRFCSRFRHPREFVHNAVVGLCWHCFEHWLAAIEALAGRGVPKGCPMCGRSYDELERASGSADVRMRLHPVDGIAMFVCMPCSDAYERKRLDLYGSTPYGERKKLKGNQ